MIASITLRMNNPLHVARNVIASNCPLNYKVMDYLNVRRLLNDLFLIISDMSLLYFSFLNKFVFMFPILNVLFYLFWLCIILKLLYFFFTSVGRNFDAQFISYIQLKTNVSFNTRSMA